MSSQKKKKTYFEMFNIVLGRKKSSQYVFLKRKKKHIHGLTIVMKHLQKRLFLICR